LFNPAARAAAAALFVSLIAGCGLWKQPAATPVVRPPRAQVSPRALLASLERRRAQLHSVRALADMRYRAPKQNLHVSEVIVVERPDRLRIEVLSTFGMTMQITSDGRVLRAYFRGERTFYRGRASSENLVRFTRLDLEVRDVIDLLAGLPPARDVAAPMAISFEDGRWRLEAPLASGGGTQVLWFEPATLLPAGADLLGRDGHAIYRAKFSAYRASGGVTVPRRISIELPPHEASLELEYSSVTANRDFPDDLFTFESPAGAKLVDLDAPAP
jgi:outer membrane lipoprotein-sorting protein